MYRNTVHNSIFLLYNLSVSTAASRLDRVLAQLRLYEHPLLNFSARAKGEGVEIIIKFKDESIPVHTYYFDLHPRDLDDSAVRMELPTPTLRRAA